jgi:hypothetical protein
MAELRYTTKKPTEPGWYWCRNQGDRPGQVWEAIAWVDRYGTIDPEGAKSDGLVAVWMSAPGELGVLHEHGWSNDCEWAGPISPPSNSETFRDRSVE